MKKNVKKIQIAFAIVVCLIVICSVIAVVLNKNTNNKVEAELQNVQVVESKTIELDNQEHIFKAEDFIQENNDNEKYGKLKLQYSEDNTTEYEITADTVKTENVNLVAHFEKYPNITKDYNVNVSIVDTTVPEFTEKVDTITINKGEELDIASKFKATDLSGDVEIKVDGTIDVNTVGEQIVNVFATDKNGNVVQTEVKVVVNEPEQKQEEKVVETSSSVANTNKSSSKKNSTATNSTKSSSKNSKSSTNDSGSKSSSKSNSSTSIKKEDTSASNSSPSNNINKSTCTNSNNHSIKCGNSGKWFNNRNECKEYMSQVWDMWSQKRKNGEITYEEYTQKCPGGYECWSCSRCGKWTVNFYYD